MGLRLLFLSVLLMAPVARAAETPFLHIRVNGIKITNDMWVPDADYDIAAVTDVNGISALHIYGKNMWNQELNLTYVIDKVRGKKQDFVPTKLPGAPTSFSATVAQDFVALKGGLVKLHALTDWKWMWLKKYGYKDLDLLLELEGSSVRASLEDGKKLQKISKMTINVGLIGASMKTE